KIEGDDAALGIIAREAAGSMRDAMSLLDQVIAWGGQKLTGEDVARVLGVASRKVLHDIAGALVGGDAARALEIVAELANQGYDDVVRSGQPRAALEMLLVRLARRPPLLPVDELVRRLAALEQRLGGARGPQPPAGPSRGAPAPQPMAQRPPQAPDLGPRNA